jgi:aldehyde:ferredoxin oxidoreductase
LPYRLTAEPHSTGPAQGKVVHLEEMLEEYYRERGWSKDGVPTETKLKELGLI